MFTVTTHCAFMSTECVCVYACSVQVHFFSYTSSCFCTVGWKNASWKGIKPAAINLECSHLWELNRNVILTSIIAMYLTQT